MIMFIIFGMLLTGCAGTTGPDSGQKPPLENPADQSISEYFPHTVGSTWKYKGEGNEYASFIREVLYTDGDKAQMQDNNGGTISQSVYRITDNEIVRTFFQGEEYEEKNFIDEESNDNTVLLKKPLKTGEEWQEPNGIREIIDTNSTVETPAGKFEGCIKIEIDTQGSVMFEYYKAGVGLVKREFISGDTTITSSLEEFTIKK